MTREGALLVILAVTVLAVAALAWSWRRRARRDAGLHAPVGELPAESAITGTFRALYVATTRHDEPMERLAIAGLDFRSRADVTVATAGVALDLTGRPRVTIPAADITGVEQATLAIDRVVERDGLVRLSWRIDDDTVVDSYLRPQEASARALADAVRGIRPLPTGNDA
ncbi:PH-like domain-containing protein [Microbacterium aureliae]